MRVASIQLEIPPGETKEERVARAATLVEQQAGADLVLLPEIWNVGYFNFDDYAAQAETLDGPTVSRMADAARRVGAWVLGGSIVERDGDQLHNTAVLLDRTGEIAGTYRKIHLFGYGSREPEVLTRGTQPAVIETEFGRVGISTCYDLRFPELYRAMLDRGAMMFLVPSAWPHPRVEAWTILNRARALENQVWLISANCAGGSGAGLLRPKHDRRPVGNRGRGCRLPAHGPGRNHRSRHGGAGTRRVPPAGRPGARPGTIAVIRFTEADSGAGDRLRTARRGAGRVHRARPGRGSPPRGGARRARRAALRSASPPSTGSPPSWW